MNSIILFLFDYIHVLHECIYYLLQFIMRTHSFRQWRHEELHSPKYQRYKTDQLPKVIQFYTHDYRFLIDYYFYKYGTNIKPIIRKSKTTVTEDLCCPRCNAPHDYIYDNNGGKGQYTCKVCSQRFSKGVEPKQLKLLCPHCNHTLEAIKSKKFFRIHKCKNSKCTYYINNKKKVPKDISHAKLSRYKLHYIYREFTVDFFKVDLDSLPNNASSLKFRKHSPYIMGLCLTYYVNLKLSLRETSQAMKEIHNVDISRTMIANYAKTAALMIKPFTDRVEMNPTEELTADETYIKVKGLKGYVWFIADAVKRTILGYAVSDDRTVGPCILAMRDAFRKYASFPKGLTFIADGYSAYPLAAQQFELENEEHKFDITQVMGLTNDDDISKLFRPYKQIIERLNRTFKRSYKLTNGYNNFQDAYYGVALWVIYYNFLRPHKHSSWKPLVTISELDEAETMPAKWQLLIFYGQRTIIELQENKT